MSSGKLNVFVSYSHADDPRWLQRVQVHLKPLARDCRLDLWDDNRVKGGDRWRQEIRDAINRADVAVLLISADFYASDFIARNELPPLLEAERERGLVILGVHINYSRFNRDRVLSEYQTVNAPDRPIASLSVANREKVFDDLARRVEELVVTKEPTEAVERFPSIRPRPRLGRIYGDVPKRPLGYQVRWDHLVAIRSDILDGGVGARRTIALQGMAGVGKTVLAAAVVADSEMQVRFPDGIIWLTLGQTPNLVSLQQRLLAWIVPGSAPPSDVQTGRRALEAALKSKRCLVVLDDVWRQTDLRAFEVTDTSSRFLITTRNKEVVCASGAVRHVVSELAPLEARALLAEAAGLTESDLPPLADDVIRECGHMPLALALAGATIAAGPQDEALWHQVLEALAAASRDQLSHEMEYPHAHALAAIQASVDFLSPEDRTAYLQLAVFPEDTPIPLAPLEKLWRMGIPKVRDRVRLFVDLALARRQDDGTILLHDLQGDFVRQRCPNVAATHDLLLRRYRPEGVQPWRDVVDDGYILDWLAYHLTGADRDDELRNLLFDLGWMRRKLFARSVNALIADVELCSGDEEARQLGRALRMSAHVLNRDEDQLEAQLLGRLSQDNGNRTKRLLERALQEIPAAALIPRGAKHLLPPGGLVQTFQGHSGSVHGAAVIANGERALTSRGQRTASCGCGTCGAGRAGRSRGTAARSMER